MVSSLLDRIGRDIRQEEHQGRIVFHRALTVPWKFVSGKLNKSTSKGPDITSHAEVAADSFGGEVEGRASEAGDIPHRVGVPGETEVSDAQEADFIDEDIRWFQVSVHDGVGLVLVQHLETTEQLTGVLPEPGLGHRTCLFQQIDQGTITA